MSFDVTIQHDLKKLQRDLNALETKATPQATIRTLNKLADSAKVASAKHIAPQIGSTQSGVKRRIKRVSARGKRLWATLVARGKDIPLIEFVVGSKKVTQQKGGKLPRVRVKVKGKTETLQHAFITHKRRGQKKKTVYERLTRKQYPLELQTGPGIAEHFAAPSNERVMEEKVKERFVTEFRRNLAFYVERIKRR